MLPLHLLLLPALVMATPPRTDRALDRDFRCPETLPSDAARIAATRDYVQRYGAAHPGSRIGERMAARDRLLLKRKCRAETLHYTFPED